MTERLYYTDAYTAEFDAVILKVMQHDGRAAVVLDRTAFYPTSGGQPHDTGTLASARVLEVVEAEDGGILHVVDREVAPGSVRGSIDWDRRFDHMQQHTGQHVLSAAFDRLLQARTVSFHLGSASASIDLAREVSPAEIARVERDANRIVWEDRPVNVRFADGEEVARLPLRKEPARGGVLRLVEVDGSDLSACGGTHVARTGAIGIVAVASWERFKGGTRVEFLCGGRALAGYHALRDAVAASVRLISVLPGELPAGIERLQAEGKEAKRQIRDQQGRLAGFEAEKLVAHAEGLGPWRVVLAALDGWDPNGLKALACAIVDRPRHIAVLFGGPAPAAVVAARGEAVAFDCAVLLKSLTTAFGGKGGGRPDLAQGGGLDAPAGELIARARALLQDRVILKPE
ncbi:DHHA1 domain-containing protein [soil metagenome]